MQYPLDAAADSDGNVYVADRRLPGVWKIEKGKRSALFTASKKFRTPLNAVWCVAVSPSQEGSPAQIFAGDSATREVYQLSADQPPKPLTQGGIGIPISLAVAASGEIYAADMELQRIWKIPAGGGKPELFCEVPAPRGVWLDKQNRLWVVSQGKDQLLRFTADGKKQTIVAGRPFRFPHSVAVDAENNAYVSDSYSKAVWKVPAGEGAKPQKWASGQPLIHPAGLAWSGQQLLTADPKAKTVFQISPEGKVLPLGM